MQGWLFNREQFKPEKLPSFEEEVAYLGRVPAILYSALEDAAFKARSAQDRDFPGDKVEPGLTAAWFRGHALRNLRSQGLDAQEDGCRWTLNKIPFAGISFYFRDRHIRVLKGTNGMMPGCGFSLKKRRFYNQARGYYIDGEKQSIQTNLNLIVLWDLHFNGGLSQLWLACPIVGGRRPEDVVSQWCEPLRHPGEMRPPTAMPPTNDDPLDDMFRKLDDDQEDLGEQKHGG